MKPLKKLLIMILSLSLFLPMQTTFAHSGRTDANGGHRDTKNVSGLGPYHFHCGGHPAHAHTNGICPYSAKAKSKNNTTEKTSKYYKVSTVKKVQKKLNKLGYSCGKADGSYGKKTKKAIKKFQKKKHMTMNGKINKKLLKKLKIKI